MFTVDDIYMGLIYLEVLTKRCRLAFVMLHWVTEHVAWGQGWRYLQALLVKFLEA